MNKALLSIFLVVFMFALEAQNTNNPFELTPRLDEEEQVQDTSSTTENAATTNSNPFELEGRLNTPESTANPVETERNNANPFDLHIPAEEPSSIVAPSPREEAIPETSATDTFGRKQQQGDADGPLLTITLLLLAFASITLIFFRSLYYKTYQALFNDNLLSLLYREREAGAWGSFIIAYMVFFLGGGLFICLLARHFDWASPGSLWQQYGLSVLGLMAFFVGKHIVLALLSYIFPISKEIKRYSFTIMSFAIVLGLVLTFGSILLAYTPEKSHSPIIYTLLAVVVIIYVLRSARGFFIANRFLFGYQFHFLSYICAVEIGPVLCLYKLLTDF